MRRSDSSSRDYVPTKLYRNTRRGKISGVCAGIAEYFGWRLSIVRCAALFGLFIFTWPVLVAYVVASIVLEEKPKQPKVTDQVKDFWRGLRTKPAETAGDLRHRFREQERRMRHIEAYVTSPRFKLDRDLRDLES